MKDRILLERKCLYLFLIDRQFFLQVGRRFSEDSFSESAHKFIFKCLQIFRGKLTYDTFSIELRKKKPKDTVIIKYLDIFNVIQGCKVSKNERDYVVDELLLRIGADETAKIMKGYLDLVDKGEYREAENLFHRRARVLRQQSMFLPVDKGEVTEDFKGRLKGVLEKKKDVNIRYGVLTGIKNIDKYSGGLYPGEVGTIFGLTSVGKSVLAMQFAHYARVRGKKVLFISLEMPKNQVQLRYDSMVSGLDYKDKLKFGQVTKKDIQKWVKSLRTTGQMNGKLFVVGVPPLGFTPENVVDILEEYEELDHYFDLLVVDYINLMDSGSKGGNGGNWLDLARIMRIMKGVAIEKKLAVWLVAQQRDKRDKEDDYEPDSYDIGYSKTIAQVSDMMVVLFKTGQDVEEDLLSVKIAKMRDGQTNITFRVKPEFKHMRIRSI